MPSNFMCPRAWPCAVAVLSLSVTLPGCGSDDSGGNGGEDAGGGYASDGGEQTGTGDSAEGGEENYGEEIDGMLSDLSRRWVGALRYDVNSGVSGSISLAMEFDVSSNTLTIDADESTETVAVDYEGSIVMPGEESAWSLEFAVTTEAFGQLRFSGSPVTDIDGNTLDGMVVLELGIEGPRDPVTLGSYGDPRDIGAGDDWDLSGTYSSGAYVAGYTLSMIGE